jgi:glycosyltransferase involved in cell wall biosynthesis
MTQALAAAGVEVDVATTDDDGAGRLAVLLGTPVRRGDVTYWFFARQTHFYKVSLPLTRWLADHAARYDVAHLHALFSYSTAAGAWSAARAGVPYVVRPLGTLNRVGMEQYHRTLKRVSFSLVERRILERAAYLHFTSEAERAQAEAAGVRQRSVVIPTGVAKVKGAEG